MIFLDMVGTITDTVCEKGALLEIGREIKARFDMPLSAGEVWEAIDHYRRPAMERRDIEYRPIRDLIVEAVEELLKARGKILTEEDRRWLKELYISAHERHVCLAENSLDGIKLMRKTVEHLGVVSDADDDYLRRVLNALGIDRFFDSITSSEEAGVGKPNPRIFERAKKKVGGLGAYYYIGDSERRDIAGGRKVGMCTILISREQVESSADYVARDLLEAAMWIADREENARKDF